MITTEVISNDFVDWLRTSDSYKNNFSVQGARALYDYLYDYSEETGEPMDFDPIAWCCEFTEYKTALEAYNEYHGADDEGVGTSIGDDNTAENAELQANEWLNDNTAVISFDGGIIIQDF